MGLVIEITEGIQKGEKFRVFNKATLGRKKADITIRDPNVSTFHAVIAVDESGIPILIDQGSRNGLIVNDTVVRKLALYPETQFTVGNTEFIVKHISDEALEELFPSKTWKQLLAEEIAQSTLNTAPPEDMRAFNPKIELSFIQGVQTDEVQVLGFGPRTAGFYFMDIQLFDPNAPDLAFKIIPMENGAKIVNFDLSKVYLNGSVFESAALVSGDRIKIGESLIRVLFLE